MDHSNPAAKRGSTNRSLDQPGALPLPQPLEEPPLKVHPAKPRAAGPSGVFVLRMCVRVHVHVCMCVQVGGRRKDPSR